MLSFARVRVALPPRALIADVLRLRSFDLVHIDVHPYAAAARNVDGKLTYAAPPELL